MNDRFFRNAAFQPAKVEISCFTCWYCDHPVADDHRFCDKACAEAFEDDEHAVERRVLATQYEPRILPVSHVTASC